MLFSTSSMGAVCSGLFLPLSHPKYLLLGPLDVQISPEIFHPLELGGLERDEGKLFAKFIHIFKSKTLKSFISKGRSWT